MLKKIKKWPMSTQNMAKNNKKIIIINLKIKNKNKLCRGGGGSSLFSLADP